jgi:hypothetical protein
LLFGLLVVMVSSSSRDGGEKLSVYEVAWLVRYQLLSVLVVFSLLCSFMGYLYITFYTPVHTSSDQQQHIPVLKQSDIQGKSYALQAMDGICCRMGPPSNEPNIITQRILPDYRTTKNGTHIDIKQVVFLIPVHVDTDILKSNFFQFSRKHVANLIVIQDCPTSQGTQREPINRLTLHGKLNYHLKEVTTHFRDEDDQVYTVCVQNSINDGISRKVRRGMKAALELFPKAKWFVKLDVDSYLLVENILHMLSKFNQEKPYYLGQVLEFSEHQLSIFYQSGGGYVLSRPALKESLDCIVTISTREDVDLGFCMKSRDIPAINIQGFYDSSLLKAHIPAYLGQRKVSKDHPKYQPALAILPMIIHKMSLEEGFLWEYLLNRNSVPLSDFQPEVYSRKNS